MTKNSSTSDISQQSLKTEQISEFQETVNCTVCGSNQQKIVFEATREDFSIESLKEEFRSSGGIPLCDQLVECAECGMRYVSPRLRQEIMIQSYADGEDQRFIEQNPSRIRNFEKHLRIADKRGLLHEGMSVFDVGSAGGAFLKACKDRGYQVSGCEPNSWLCSWAKENYGIDIKPGILSDHLPIEERFDLVTIWDVLEHVPDPRQLILQAKSILKKNGVLILTFPDISRIIPRMLGRKWSYLSTVHLWYFTPDHIRRLLEESGLKVEGFSGYANRLQLGYVFERAKETIGFFSVFEKLSRWLRISKIEVSYYLGQTMVMARLDD